MSPSVGSTSLWIFFTVLVAAVLAIDLGVFQRRADKISQREAVLRTVAWTLVAMLFNGVLFLRFGSESGLQFLTGYVIEYALSADNVFIFLLIFRYFAVPVRSQHRVLFWGVLGALVMRGCFIYLGVLLLAVPWIIYIFGLFLVYSGVRLLQGGDLEVHPERNPVIGIFRKLVPMTSEYGDSRFLVRQAGRWLATPLLLVLVIVESMDLIFAVDSIPAVFGVSRDPFIVLTSNMFAILGLRSLYFVLAASVARFRYLTAGVGGTLAFIGLKMLLNDYYPISTRASLAIVAALLGTSVLGSLFKNSPEDEPPGDSHAGTPGKR